MVAESGKETKYHIAREDKLCAMYTRT